MHVIVEDQTIVGISDTEAGIYVPDSVGENIESLLLRSDVIIKYINGDITVVGNPSYWQHLFESEVIRLTKPTILEINYGELLKFPKADLPIVVAFANEPQGRNRCYTDNDGNLHMLTTYEWKNVLELICDTLSQLAQIQCSVNLLKADSESRYEDLCVQLNRKVAAAYGRS